MQYFYSFLYLLAIFIILLISMIIPQYIQLRKRNNITPKSNFKSIEKTIRNSFLLNWFKVKNDEKSIDEVYKRISKYQGNFKVEMRK